MALTGKLTIDNHTYNILECEYEFNQMIEINGRPSGQPRGGLLNIVIVAPDDADVTLHEWMKDKNTIRNGTLNLTVNKDNKTAKKTIQFENAYCVRLYEYFNGKNDVQMYMKISILPGKITFGNKCDFNMIDKS
jgi:hypothetical protein